MSLVSDCLFLHRDWNEDQPRDEAGKWSASSMGAKHPEGLRAVREAIHGARGTFADKDHQFHQFANTFEKEGAHPNLAESYRPMVQMFGHDVKEKDPVDRAKVLLSASAGTFALQAATHLAAGREKEAIEHSKSAQIRIQQYHALVSSPKGQMRERVRELESRPSKADISKGVEHYLKTKAKEEKALNKLQSAYALLDMP